MRAAIQRRADVLRIQVELFLLAAQHATPGPWDAHGSWVISTSMKEGDDDSNDFYGGALIGESMRRADAVVVAAARELIPALCHAYLNFEPELHEARRWLQFYKRVALEMEHERDELRTRAAIEADRAQALISYKDAEILRLRDRLEALNAGIGIATRVIR